MAGKRDKPEEIVLKLRQVEVLQGQGMATMVSLKGRPSAAFFRFDYIDASCLTCIKMQHLERYFANRALP